MLVMSEAGFDPGITDEERAERLRIKQVELASLPPQRYPRLVEAAVPLTACTDDASFHYQFGVDLFMAGVQAMAPGGGPGGTASQGQHIGGAGRAGEVVSPGQHGGS
jgi:hypothetical protein